MGRTGAGLFLAVLVVAALGAGYLAVNSGQRGSTSTSTSSQPCSSPIPSDPVATPADVSGGGIYNEHVLANGTYRWLIFTMKPGGVATFCIDVPLRQGNVTAGELGAEAQVMNVTSPGSGCCAFSHSEAQNINVTFDPAALNLTSFPRSAGSLSILYTMTTDRNATGFYSLSYPGACGLIPLAVTDEPQRVSASDFFGFFVPSTCPLFPPFDGWSRMTGFSGMTAAWVNGIPGEAP
jgi:hypothetical protein